MNQDVKVILVRHSVDLTQLNHSCNGSSVHLYGELRKDPPGDFSPAGIESLLQEISRLPNVKYIQCDIKDWVINSEYGSWLVMRKKKADSTPPREDTVLIIDEHRVDTKAKGRSSD